MMRKRIPAAVLTAGLVLTLSIPAAAANPGFEDVPVNAWYAGAVEYCQERSLMAGTDETHFSPGDVLTHAMTAAWTGSGSDGGAEPGQAVTREELALLLWQQAGSPEVPTELPFTDAEAISSGAVKAAAWANAEGLITGKPNARLDPGAAVTRAETATVLMRRDLGVNANAQPTENSILDTTAGACGMAVMEDGSLLVTDLYNRKIWKVTDGKAEVYAGSDTVKDANGKPLGGDRDGSLTESQFGAPWAVAPWGDGWAVSDADNDALRHISGQQVQTISKDFSHPTGLAADGEGNLYISDTLNGTIRKLDADGTLTVAAGDLDGPMGLCWKNGALYIAETGANRISKLEGDALTVVAGSGEDGGADGPTITATFSGPTGVAVADDGTIYVSDTGNSAIRRICYGNVDTFASRDYGAGDLRLIDPAGLLIRGETLLVCDSFARTVLEYSIG